MDADFARWYLWAKLMETTHADDPDARLLVMLLRQVDDLELRHEADPNRTAGNLLTAIADTIIQVLGRMLVTHPEAAPPR